MQKSKKRKPLGLYVIILSFIGIITACVWTIVFSLDYPVYMDNYYFSSVDEVDRNINEIEASQERFEEKYSLTLVDKVIYQGKDSQVKAIARANLGSSLDNLSGEILLTRPDTSEFDKNLKFKFEDIYLISENFKVNKPGRWQVFIKLSDGKDTGFYKFELIASWENLLFLQIVEI